MNDFLTVEDDILIADRSTLERFETCPAQAQFVASGRVLTGSHDAEVGSAIHSAFGEVVRDYVDSRGHMSVSDLSELAAQLLCASRPDVQFDVLRASRPSLWAWAKYISDIHPENILRWDGGEGEHCGQLAWDLDDLGVRVTSEVDLLHTGRATEVVTEIDYKTGHKLHTAASVERSFQFAMHAWLILENYDEVECVQVRVWNTRRNLLTYACTWTRRDLYALQYRIRASVQNWKSFREVEAERCPTWPTPEKCRLCDAAALCPAVPQDMRQLLADPGSLVETIVAESRKLEALEELAASIVERTGRDIIAPSGAAFGTGKPKRETKPRKALYEVQTEGNDNGEGTD